jgi:nucleoside-diphosphate-sugar epimerase
MTRILVTGATGFVGQGLIQRLTADKRPFRSAVRGVTGLAGETIAVGDIGPETDWASALDGIDTVFHLAGRAHIFASERDPLAGFRKVNALGTARLAEQAEAAGVRRFVLLSSVKAALDTSGLTPVTENEPPTPRTPYGISKLEGEQALRAAAGKMEIVILRPPLVYGPGVRANFLALLKLVDRGIPLPLGSVRNLRSLIARDNLVDAILTAADAHAAVRGTFYVTDGPPLSTPDLIRELARALGKQAKLMPFPRQLMRLTAAAMGRADAADSLLGSLVVSDAALRAATGWGPPLTARTAFAEVAAWYKQAKGRI